MKNNSLVVVKLVVQIHNAFHWRLGAEKKISSRSNEKLWLCIWNSAFLEVFTRRSQIFDNCVQKNANCDQNEQHFVDLGTYDHKKLKYSSVSVWRTDQTVIESNRILNLKASNSLISLSYRRFCRGRTRKILNANICTATPARVRHKTGRTLIYQQIFSSALYHGHTLKNDALEYRISSWEKKVYQHLRLFRLVNKAWTSCKRNDQVSWLANEDFELWGLCFVNSWGSDLDQAGRTLIHALSSTLKHYGCEFCLRHEKLNLSLKFCASQ